MFGYTAQQTLDAVQEMYEQKLVTYPRTDSQYLTDEMGESTEELIQMLIGKMSYADGLEYQPDVKKVLNSKKVSDHHAIIPTMEVAKTDVVSLKDRNRNILYLISARVLTATADSYVYESHKCQITCKLYEIATFKNGKYDTAIKYYLVETKTLDGYTLDQTKHEVTFAYADDNTPVVEVTFNLTNEKPEVPETPSTPDTPQSHEETKVSDAPKTGDNTNIWLPILLLLISTGGMAGLYISRKKIRK